MDRRQFLSMTAVTGATAVAGCGGSTDDSGTTTGDGTSGGSTDTATTDGTTGNSATTGSFRLLISDRPADIGDFDSLDVTFDSARVHRQQSEDDETEEDTETEDGTATATETAEETETAEPTATETVEETDDEGTDSDDGEDDSERGFTVFDLDSPTVDLTQVVGEKAIGVLDGKLETGEYSKIELYVSDTEGIVDGETVDVKVPSNKLQIQKEFEITADGTVEFVFDINVVKKGNGGYNLLPVISESGVAGKDVEVEEVDADDEDEDEDETDEESTDEDETESSTESGTETESGTATEA